MNFHEVSWILKYFHPNFTPTLVPTFQKLASHLGGVAMLVGRTCHPTMPCVMRWVKRRSSGSRVETVPRWLIDRKVMGTGFYIFFYHFLGCWNPPNPQQHKKQIQHERFSESRWWFQTLVNFFPSICGFRFNLNIFQNGLVTVLGRFFFPTPSLLLQEFVTIMFSNRFWKPSMDTGHLHSTCQRFFLKRR